MIVMKKETSLIAAIIVVTGIAITLSLTQFLISLFIDYVNWFSNNRIYGFMVFMLLYVIFGVIALPASFHKYLAGVIYGFGPGLMVAWIGSMIGAITPFILGKKWMNPYARKVLHNYPSLSSLEHEIVDNGTYVVALTRVSLVIPYGVLNYAYGATNVKFKDFIIGNIAMLVPAAMYAWWGSQTVITANGLETAAKTPFDFFIIACSIIITIFMIYKGKKIMDNLQRISSSDSINY